MPYATYQVARFDRRTRRTLEIVASGLTMQAASSLAAALRADADDLTGYAVATMPLHEQVSHATAAEVMAALNAGARSLAA